MTAKTFEDEVILEIKHFAPKNFVSIFSGEAKK